MIELKTWIPQRTAEGTAPDPRYNCGPSAIGQRYFYNGNDHADYGGDSDTDYKTLLRYEFIYSDTGISDVSVTTLYGITRMNNGLCTTEARADHTQNVTAPDGPASFRMNASVADPMISGAPSLDAVLSMSFVSPDHLRADFKTDKFPSYGFRVIKNGRTVATVVDFDASCKSATGKRGMKNVATGLTAGKRGDWHHGHHEIDTRVNDQQFFGPCGKSGASRPTELGFPAS